MLSAAEQALQHKFHLLEKKRKEDEKRRVSEAAAAAVEAEAKQLAKVAAEAEAKKLAAQLERPIVPKEPAITGETARERALKALQQRSGSSGTSAPAVVRKLPSAGRVRPSGAPPTPYTAPPTPVVSGGQPTPAPYSMSGQAPVPPALSFKPASTPPLPTYRASFVPPPPSFKPASLPPAPSYKPVTLPPAPSYKPASAPPTGTAFKPVTGPPLLATSRGTKHAAPPATTSQPAPPPPSALSKALSQPPAPSSASRAASQDGNHNDHDDDDDEDEEGLIEDMEVDTIAADSGAATGGSPGPSKDASGRPDTSSASRRSSDSGRPSRSSSRALPPHHNSSRQRSGSISPSRSVSRSPGRSWGQGYGHQRQRSRSRSPLRSSGSPTSQSPNRGRPGRSSRGGRQDGSGDNECTLFVGDLPGDMVSSELKDLFEVYSPVVKARVMGSQCFGFVTFKDPLTATRVLDDISRMPVVARGIHKLRVARAKGQMEQWKQGPAFITPRAKGQGPEGIESYENPKAREARRATAAMVHGSGGPAGLASQLRALAPQDKRGVRTYDDL